MAAKRIKIGEYKQRFQGIFFTIEHAEVVFPSGKTTTFERAVRIPSVAVLPITADKKLLLLRERKLGKVSWGIVAGRIDKEVNPKAAAQRELQEETGFKARKLSLFFKGGIGQYVIWPRYVFIAQGLIPSKLEGDEDEDIEVVPVPVTKAYKMVLAGEIESELAVFLLLKLYRERKKWNI